MQLPYAILYGLERTKGERTGSSMYHLLTGKRSSQTLQDGHMYGLSFLFGTYKRLDRQEYNRQIEALLTGGRLQQIQENTYVLTEDGKRWLDEAQQWAFPAHLDGLQYGEAGDMLWKRLNLIVQTLSHLQRRQSVFVPLVTDQSVTAWVRQFFLRAAHARAELAAALFAELHIALAQLPEQEAALFVSRLSGAERIGLTEEQLAQQRGMDPLRIHFLFLAVLHFLVRTAASAPRQYPLLHSIAAYKGEQLAALSASTERTYELWQQGRSLAEIARMRRLKLNTIEDHFVEIALHDRSFPMEQFLDADKAERIRCLMEELQTRKLRILKEHAGPDCSYFEIRLVLAAWGGQHEA
ncbi:helix-turn-helix domain-containing protein [Ectobacillus ponti]|uniref:Helix-turn-helix domain-containing protein n=1 Tax=Ectobacillus ponti TaxID=2961894 RepID=A0AA42BP51_9BACI|nr:helix-turn-helix domain-containing protein [Ectobacillus ponti]MCP8968725.1 helix-turn-helix domain-containing protein [Ectobacillus ponti]